jgi:hypothetical protein
VFFPFVPGNHFRDENHNAFLQRGRSTSLLSNQLDAQITADSVCRAR